ncbi:MAG: ParB/RepB/Spo0J family partition protein [Desulfobacterales bacterium]|nr:ParB/RepB/Spo0J family partition protein [Desulfobacterales bacterium]MDD4072237.1 ParB/RepB/Spo0J family partition protein [Desulfobacterales bacterium]
MQDTPPLKKNVPPPAKPRKKMALGRGLDALIPDIGSIDNDTEYFQCDINRIHANRYQPRMTFSGEDLAQLCDSIKERGILQPLLVRKDQDRYELIAGERRLRAAKMAGLARVPVIIKHISDKELLELSIIENIQRENLNPLEEADAYHRLITEFDLTQEQAAGRVGKSRSSVANMLRLRQLPDQIKASIIDSNLSMGHARALLGAETLSQQIAAWKTVLAKELSVRETERLIKRMKTESKEPVEPPRPSSEEIYFSNMSDDLSRGFGTRVQIKRRGDKGRVEIEFYSNEDLDRVIGLLKLSRTPAP